MSNAGKGPKPVPGFNHKRYYENNEYWDKIEKKRKERQLEKKINEKDSK
jgi:hypothetical protein